MQNRGKEEETGGNGRQEKRGGMRRQGLKEKRRWKETDVRKKEAGRSQKNHLDEID